MGVFEADKQQLGNEHTDVSPPQTVHSLYMRSRVDGRHPRRISGQAVARTSQHPPQATHRCRSPPTVPQGRAASLPPVGQRAPSPASSGVFAESLSPRRTLSGPVCIWSCYPPRIAGRLTPARDRTGVPRSAATRPLPPRRTATPPPPLLPRQTNDGRGGLLPGRPAQPLHRGDEEMDGRSIRMRMLSPERPSDDIAEALTWGSIQQCQ